MFSPHHTSEIIVITSHLGTCKEDSKRMSGLQALVRTRQLDDRHTKLQGSIKMKPQWYY